MRFPIAWVVRLSVSILLLGALGATPHMDHQPKHGGVFFMAPDQTHHLEGVLLPTGTFKIYLYDEYTRPIPAKGFEAVMRADGENDDRTLKLGHDSEDGTLSVRDLSVERFPVDLTVWITFPARPGSSLRTELFSFSFEKFSNAAKR